MKTITVGYCEASAATRAPSALQWARPGKLNRALRGAALCLALGMGTASLPAIAETRIIVRAAPPALQVEEIPAARSGYLWAPGYWRWQNRQHVWARGHWERERRGHRYESARWDQRGERYQFAPGRWQREANRGNSMRDGERRGERRQ